MLKFMKSKRENNQIENGLGRDSEAMQRWLVNYLSRHLECDVATISHKKSFAEQGLDSLGTIQLLGDMEKWLDLELEPAMLYEYQSIELLVPYLMTQLDANPSQA